MHSEITITTHNKAFTLILNRLHNANWTEHPFINKPRIIITRP